MSKISKRLLLLLLVAALAATLTFSVVACNKGNDPIEEGWYLSLSSSGHPVYDNVSSVPDAVAMKEEGGVWSISVTLAQNEQFFIKSTSGKSVGFDSVFSAATQLVAGDDGAIKVAVAGAYVLSYDGESITYSYTPPAAVQLTGIALSQTTLALEKGASQSLVLSFLPEGAAPVGVIWTSSDQSVASVTQEGVVTAVNYGTATITVTATSGGFSATCTVTVIKHATGLYLSASQLSVVAGGEAKDVSVGLIPADASEFAYLASLTQGAEFAELSDDGEGNISVYGKAEGTAILSVSLVSDPGSVATCEITILPEGSVLVDFPESLDMKIGEETTITASLENYSGRVTKSSWTVSGSAVKIMGNGTSATLTAKDFGTSTVTVVLFDDQNNTYRSNCTVYVGEDYFFIYGYGLGSKDWDWEPYVTDSDAAEAKEILLHEESKGVWTLTRELTPDNGFQIIFPSVGSFNEDVDGEQKWNKNIPSDLVDVSNYYDSSRSDNALMNNHSSYFCVKTPGMYKITLDLTGASAKVYINSVSLEVTSVTLSLAKGEYIMRGVGAECVVNYSILPAQAKVADNEVQAELTSDFAGFENYIGCTLDLAAKSVVLKTTALPSKTFTVTLHLNVREIEKTLDFYVFGDEIVPVTSISFDQESYEFNLNNGMSNYTTYVSAHVNANATNQQIRYSIYFPETASDGAIWDFERSNIGSVDPVTGAVTKNSPGTLRIKAQSLENPDIWTYADVLFYTDSYYLIQGSVNGWNALSPGVTSLENTGYLAVPRIPGSKTQYRLEVLNGQIDGHYLGNFIAAFLGMNENWSGQIQKARISLGNATEYWTDADFMNDVGHIKLMYLHQKSYELIIDISTQYAVLVINVIDDETFNGFGLYPFGADREGIVTDYNNTAWYQHMKALQSVNFRLVTIPEAKISAGDLTFAWENNDGDFTYEFDADTCEVTIKRLDTLREEDNISVLHVTYRGVTRKFYCVASATHHWVQKYDDTHHWMECSDEGCGERKDETEHVMSGNWQMDRAKGEHYHACRDCGYTCDHAAHIFASASKIDLTNGNVPACSVCGEKVVAIENNRLVGYYGNANEIVLPDTLTEICAHIFDGHTELSSINWPSSLKTIGDYAFRDCTGLPEFTLPKAVTTIGQYAFSGFKSKITIPAGSQLGFIGAHAFDGCLGDIAIKGIGQTSGGTLIGEYAFANSGITSLDIKCNHLILGTGAFENCTELRTVTIASLMFEAIPAYAFYGCISLEWVYILDSGDPNNLFRPDWWTNLYFYKFCDKAFDGCASLEGIYIEKSAGKWCAGAAGAVDPAYSYEGDCSAIYGKLYLYTESGDTKQYNFAEGHIPYIAGIWHYAGNVRKFSRIELWD